MKKKNICLCGYRVYRGVKMIVSNRNEHSFVFCHAECLEYTKFFVEKTRSVIDTESITDINYNGYTLRLAARGAVCYSDIWKFFGIRGQVWQVRHDEIRRDMRKHGIRLGGA